MTVDMNLLGSKFALALANKENRKARITELKKSLLGYCTLDEKMKVVVEDVEGFEKAKDLIKVLVEKNATLDDQLNKAELILNSTGFLGPGEIVERMNVLNNELHKLGARFQKSKVPEEMKAWREHRHNLPMIKKIEEEKQGLMALIDELKANCPELI